MNFAASGPGDDQQFGATVSPKAVPQGHFIGLSPGIVREIARWYRRRGGAERHCAGAETTRSTYGNDQQHSRLDVMRAEHAPVRGVYRSGLPLRRGGAAAAAAGPLNFRPPTPGDGMRR